MIRVILLFLLCVATIPLSGAKAQLAVMNQYSVRPDVSQKPLMIIRFNQDKVFYKRPLYRAMHEAVTAAPDVLFHVVSYIPQKQSAEHNQRARRLAQQHLQMVVGEMQKMGVSAAQIRTASEPDYRLRYDEIHIFVE